MDVNKATIVFVGEIQGEEGKKKLVIDVTTPKTHKTRYIIYQNDNHHFDIVRQFENKWIVKGDQIDFNFNIARGNYFPNIWQFANHKKK